MSSGLTAAEELSSAINTVDQASVASRIKEHAEDQLGHAFEKLVRQREALKQDVAAAERLWSLVSSYLQHARPANAPGKATDMGPRVSSAEVALRLCAISQRMADTIFSEVAALTNDPSAAVRFTFDPEAVFDLIAHALLQGGARHGYQFESLATDRFAEIVGVYLADHRGIFADSGRREKLIACLDIFVEAGWPKARRLLYRLPELL